MRRRERMLRLLSTLEYGFSAKVTSSHIVTPKDHYMEREG